MAWSRHEVQKVWPQNRDLGHLSPFPYLKRHWPHFKPSSSSSLAIPLCRKYINEVHMGRKTQAVIDVQLCDINIQANQSVKEKFEHGPKSVIHRRATPIHLTTGTLNITPVMRIQYSSCIPKGLKKSHKHLRQNSLDSEHF
ncbi:hypothetical protein Pcinc_011106 [Petrolisthes cinctipes]|uniref:Uncharacterized protein n=1 Tax=Petrolisthes cinctipes TaxID=88211 RepID=A0AAE1G1G1_PETCI|nr:hypothetical protein Pcinc_011106 [Petrolisthes cinctipes]